MSKERKTKAGAEARTDAPVSTVAGKKMNARRFLRLPLASPTAVRYLNGDPATKTFLLSRRIPGTLLNVGAGGALVLCEHAPQPGELLTLDLRLSDDFEFGGILGKVKRVEPDLEGGFLVGIEFGSMQTLCFERAGWQLPPGVVRCDDAFREALHHFLFQTEVQRRSEKQEQPGKDAS